jgi:hypothetical protein
VTEIAQLAAFGKVDVEQVGEDGAVDIVRRAGLSVDKVGAD